MSRDGGRVLCRLPDGTVRWLPEWMLQPESSHFTVGKPLVSVHALSELREFLSTLQTSIGCGKASLNAVPKEGIDETAEAPRTSTASFIPAGSAGSESATGQTKRPCERTGGTSFQGRGRNQQ
jgi:hypothetical protein